MIFVMISIVIWGLYTFLMKRRQKENFRMFKALLPLVIFSIIVSFGLGINYVVSAIPGIHDGIGIDNFLAYWIIGEGNWSISLFKNYFKYSLMTSIILLIIYSGMRIQKD